MPYLHAAYLWKRPCTYHGINEKKRREERYGAEKKACKSCISVVRTTLQ